MAAAILLLTLTAGVAAERIRPLPTLAGPSTLPAALDAQSYPVLSMQLTDSKLNAPAVVPAGRFLVAVENASATPGEVVVARLPAGVNVQTALIAPDATALPWLLQATYPGGPGVAAPGQQTAAIVDLAPGQYVAFAVDEDRPYGNDPGRRMAGFVVETMAGTASMTAPALSADGSVALTDDAITIPATVLPGRHLWQVTNTGQQPHELRLLKAPGPLTLAQVLAAVTTTNPAQTPPPGGLTYQRLVNLPAAGGLSWLSSGQAAWAEINLPPGTYVALDLIRTPSTGVSHAFFGMVAVFTAGP